VKTTGPPVGNVVPIARAFDGTTAAVHLASAVVSGFVDAYHHNRLVAEVEAIENALGANLSKIPAVSQIVSSAYDFPAQTPGGNLTIGNNVITLSPVPLGVNGSDQNHYLYISGGTGAAEPVLITGGTAVSGATSGTVIVNCANTHSGAWTIRSATAGIREAMNSLPATGGVVMLPSGSLPIYKGITINRNSVTIQGQGVGATTLDISSMGSGPVVQMLTGHADWLRGFTILGPSTGMLPTDYAIVFDGQNACGMSNVDVAYVPNGIKITDHPSNYRIWIEYVDIGYLTGTGGVGISVEGGADTLISNLASSDTDHNDLAAIRIRKTGGTAIRNVDCLNCGLLIDPDGAANTVSWLFLTEALFDTPQNEALKVAPTNGALVMGFTAVDSWFCSSATKDGVRLEATMPSRIDNFSLIGTRIINNFHNGVALVGSGVRNTNISSSTVSSNNTSNLDYYGIYVRDAVDLVIDANSIGALPGGLSANQKSGIFFDTGATDNIVVTSNMIKDVALAHIMGMDLMTGLNRIISDNSPVSSVFNTIASADAINLTGSPYEHYYITGSIPIKTMTPFWYARKISLFFSDAAPGGVSAAGGNIVNTRTVTQNQTLLCQYDINVGWTVVGP
jgi:hypothetical protein